MFTTNVLDWDTVLSNWFLVIVATIGGGIISLVIGIILGLVQITPALRLWLNLK